MPSFRTGADRGVPLERSRLERFPTPITIGVVADTHRRGDRPLPEALARGLHGVDLILHAGDLTTERMLSLFEALAPVRAVRGNNDEPALLRRLPRRRDFEFGAFSAALIHGHGYERLTARQAAERLLVGQVDIAIFGHSHQQLSTVVGGTLLFNPGSPTDKRWASRYSYGIIRIDEAIEARLYYF